MDFTKNVSQIDSLYSAIYATNQCKKNIVVYVHGGPGGHCSDFESGLIDFKCLTSSNFAWVTYDQRGCGRSHSDSLKSISHRTNIDDLKSIINFYQEFFGKDETKIFLYGHSYGARLVYDTLFTTPTLDVSAMISGRSVHPLDAMNTSILIDTLILRTIDIDAFTKAVKCISDSFDEPYLKAKQVRECFKDPTLRQELRKNYYWVDQKAMSWWDSQYQKSHFIDSDDVYFSVASTYTNEVFNPGIFDPNQLAQNCILIQGFFDVLMNGSAKSRLENESKVIKFNGSAHYPHFEQPELFMHYLTKLVSGEMK
jgi:pimeloyl-ACP methyl ester carboxylesterase